MGLTNENIIDEDQIEQVSEFLAKGGTRANAQGITEDELEAVYVLARSLLSNGENEKSNVLFQYLCIQDHLNSRNWLALGKSQVLLGRFKEALMTFGMGTLVSGIEDVEFPLSCAEVHLRLGDLEAALSGLEYAGRLANVGGKPANSIQKRIDAIGAAIERRQSRSEASQQ